MAQSYSVLYENSMRFIRSCATVLGWKDLSKDVIMDIGCGDELSCCKALLDQFPEVKALVAVDKNKNVIPKGKSKDKRFQYRIGDILERDSLKRYEGKMDKVLSTNTLHHIIDKKLVFQNVYRLLKPGGEAAFYFSVKCDMHRFLSVFLEIPKFKAMVKGTFTKDMYPEGRRQQFYKKMLEKVGFKNVRTVEDVQTMSFPTAEIFKEALFKAVENRFVIPPEYVPTFKDEAFTIYDATIDKHEGQFRYISVEINLMGVKPIKKADLKVEKASQL